MSSITWWHFQWPWRTPNPVFKVTSFLKSISQQRCILATKLLQHTNRKSYQTHIEWDHVWWPWLTSKRVARVSQHQLSFLLYRACKRMVAWLILFYETVFHFGYCVRLFFFVFCVVLTYNTRSSADADNRLDAFSGQSRSTNMVPFHMLHIVSYCAIVTLTLRQQARRV